MEAVATVVVVEGVGVVAVEVPTANSAFKYRDITRSLLSTDFQTAFALLHIDAFSSRELNIFS